MAKYSSDIDVFIKYKHGQRSSLFDMAEIHNYLTRQLKHRVDVIPPDGFKASVRKGAEKLAGRV